MNLDWRKIEDDCLEHYEAWIGDLVVRLESRPARGILLAGPETREYDDGYCCVASVHGASFRVTAFGATRDEAAAEAVASLKREVARVRKLLRKAEEVLRGSA